MATSRGSAASEDDVETISRYSRARYLISEKILQPGPNNAGSAPSTTTMNSAQVM